VSVDETRGFITSDKVKRLEMGGVLVHRYSEDDVVATNPWMLKDAQTGRAIKMKTLELFMHMSPVIHAARFAERAMGTPPTFVWVMEDDVFVCGNLSDIVTAHASTYADIMSNGHFIINPNNGPPGHQRLWKPQVGASRAFAQRYKDDDIIVDFEFVQRFSWRLLEFFDRLIVNEHVTAESEMFAPTVCAVEPWCHRAFFNHRVIGQWDWNLIVSEPEVALLCDAHLKQGRSTLNHKAKF
jgi:hypothetical protein